MKQAPASPLRFSVVIPTYGRRDLVVDAVRALARQEGAPAFEVLVVVDGSKDGTTDALARLAPAFPFTVLEQPRGGRAAACHRGALTADGELLLFLDDDMEAAADLLAEHEHAHREGAEVVFGHIPLHPGSPRSFLAEAVGEWAESRAQRLMAQGGRLGIEDFLTGQMSLARAVYLDLGGFDPGFTRGGAFGGEDLDLGRRLVADGRRLVFNPRAVSRQRYVVTPRHYLRQWRDAGGADVLLARKHPEEAGRILRRRESWADRLVGRPLRPLVRAVVLALVGAGAAGPRRRHWFFRARDLEYFRGVREAGGPPRRGTVRVLCYHAVADLKGARVLEPYGVPPRCFAQQLAYLDRRFHVIGPDEFGRFLAGAGVPRRAVLITFDDAYADLAEEGLPVLGARNMPAAAFAVSSLLGGTNAWDAPIGAPQLPLLDAGGLRELSRRGIAVGSHTRTHPVLPDLAPHDVEAELAGSRDELERIGLRPRWLAYPFGEHDAGVRRAAAGAGYEAAFTVEPGVVRPGSDPLALPRIEIFRDDVGWRFAWKLEWAGGRRRR